jgi:flagellar biosynthetic protein FliP
VAGTTAESPAGASTSTGGLLQALPPLIAQDSEEGERSLQLNGPVGTALLLGIMALLPTLLLLATGFTRILIVLHLLKQALGAQAVPPTHLVNALALLLTLFLMAPTLDRVSEEAIDPWLEGEIDQAVMFERAAVPFRDFMLSYADEDDIVRFIEMRGDDIPPSVEDVPLTTIIAAFTTSELRRAFQLGFVLFLPFIVIDLVVASVLMSMGMFMLPPVMISLPFKLLLFVLADGWSLVIGGLLSSFL